MEVLPIEIKLKIAGYLNLGCLIKLIKFYLTQHIFEDVLESDYFWKHFFKNDVHKNILLFLNPTAQLVRSICYCSDQIITFRNYPGNGLGFDFVTKSDLTYVKEHGLGKYFRLRDGLGTKVLKNNPHTQSINYLVTSKRKKKIYTHLDVQHIKKYETYLPNDILYIDSDFIIKVGKNSSISVTLNDDASKKLVGIMSNKILSESIIENLGYKHAVNACLDLEKSSDVVC